MSESSNTEIEEMLTQDHISEYKQSLDELLEQRKDLDKKIKETKKLLKAKTMFSARLNRVSDTDTGNGYKLSVLGNSITSIQKEKLARICGSRYVESRKPSSWKPIFYTLTKEEMIKAIKALIFSLQDVIASLENQEEDDLR